MKTRLNLLESRLHNSPTPEEVRREVAVINGRPLSAESNNRFLSVILRLIAVVVVLCSVASCNTRSLSRATAEQAITASGKFPIASHREIKREYHKRDSDGLVFFYNESGMGDKVVPMPDISYFIEAGLLTSTDAGRFGPNYSNIALGFADRTKSYEVPTDNRYWMGIKLCDLVFGAITGIQVNEQAGTATVDYTIRPTNWTPFGDYYKRQSPQDFPEVIAQSATFSRYDNGWRLTR